MKNFKRVFTIFLSLVLIATMTSCSNKTKETTLVEDKKVKESVFKSGSNDSNFVQLTKINDNVWVHTTYYNINGVRTLSNGLLVLTTKGLVLLDTPWTNDQTKELIKLTKEKFNQNIIAAIVTHAHMDRIGGIKTLLDNKIDVKSTPLTAQMAEKSGYDRPNPSITKNDEVLIFGETNLEVYFPGEGHTADNIVVWLPKYKILYAGCIAKSLESNSIGNTNDANIKEWPNSVQNLINKFPNAEIVIPSHGKWGSKQILTHTLDLLKKLF
ncbi:subclass B1 metallo-beta-lactamase [Clostridium scatologenes]|uniref:beta-lactamase n=1 Tax=Clostridium scatologenes TaxID=1548 RepID=A0A0E3GR00_CLOSL|nr:subclass B1 metallo-beta-lactamase [Clostridium scatologenes]AKA69456.1 Beta-lactamase [Clostridium scatologenes]